MYRGKYRDPETAGQLYAEEVKKLIDQAHSKGKKVRTYVVCLCAVQLCSWNVKQLNNAVKENAYLGIS